MPGGSADDGDTAGDDPGDERTGPTAQSTPGVPATKRNRVKSAVLWGAVGGFAFLVLAQGYLLLGGELPFRYAWLFGLAMAVVIGATGITYLAEHRIRAERSKRRT